MIMTMIIMSNDYYNRIIIYYDALCCRCGCNSFGHLGVGNIDVDAVYGDVDAASGEAVTDELLRLLKVLSGYPALWRKS